MKTYTHCGYTITENEQGEFETAFGTFRFLGDAEDAICDHVFGDGTNIFVFETEYGYEYDEA